MKYMGSKNRIAKHILPIMLTERKEGQYWVEPFVGGANMIDKVKGNRIGADINEYIIKLLRGMSNDWIPPKHISKEEYHDIKKNPENYTDELVGYTASQLSFGCEWFGSYRRDNAGKRDYPMEAYKNVTKQSANIIGVDFRHSHYLNLSVPDNSIIYCDPPYQGVRKYIGFKDFDHDEFWQWCRNMSKKGHTVFVSEYNAPDDFECIWQKEISASANNSIKTGQGLKATEKLFTLAKKRIEDTANNE